MDKERKRKLVWQRSGGICHLCGSPVSRSNMTLDHIIPKHHGGTDAIVNLAAAHKSCNTDKGHRIVETGALDIALVHYVKVHDMVPKPLAPPAPEKPKGPAFTPKKERPQTYHGWDL